MVKIKKKKSAKPVHEERKHHLLGGSSAHRWVNCTASVGFCADIPKTVTPSMLKGTAIHEMAEVGVKAFLMHKLTGSHPTQALDLYCSALKPAIGAGKHVFKSYDELEEAREIVDGYIDSIWTEALREAITGKALGVEGEFVLNENLGIGGTADFWCIFIDDRGQRVGVIVDLKTGYTLVDIKKNHQLIEYGLSMRKWVRGQGKDLDVIETAIYQPHSEDGITYKSERYTAKQLDSWEKRLEKAAHRIVVTKKVQFKPGEWCHYCPGKNVCVKYVEDLSRKTDLVLINPKKTKFPKPETLPHKSLRALLEWGPDVVNYIRDAQKYVMGLCVSGNEFKGWKVVEGRPRRRWKPNEEKIVKGLKKLGLKDVFNKKLKPFTQIEKILGKKKISKFLMLGNAKMQLVPDDDPRPRVGNAEDYLGLEDMNDDE